MKIVCAILLLACIGFAAPAGQTLPPVLERNASVVLQVGNRDDVARKIISIANSMGGYFLQWDEWNVGLRIPSPYLSVFLKSIDSLGRPVEHGYTTDDHGAEIEDLRASIASRRKLLDEYFAIVKTSASSQVQVIQYAIVQLVSEIEREEGRLRAMESRIQESYVLVSFQFQDRSLPAPDGTSPFEWINRLNLVEHREVFE